MTHLSVPPEARRPDPGRSREGRPGTATSGGSRRLRPPLDATATHQHSISRRRGAAPATPRSQAPARQAARPRREDMTMKRPRTGAPRRPRRATAAVELAVTLPLILLLLAGLWESARIIEVQQVL